MAEKLNPFYKLPKTEVPINITSELKQTFSSVNKALDDAFELALKQPIPENQLVLMTDASFRSAGYALMVEDNPNQNIQSKRKTYAPVAFGSKVFSPAQLKMSIYSRDFLAICMAFLKFAQILWEATKPTIVVTDIKSVTRFFQTKAIPPALWNACDYVLQFNFKIAHIAGSVKTAADFLCRLELKVRERYVSKSGKISKQHLSRWPPLPVMLQTKNNFSSHTQTTITSQKNRPLNGKNDQDKMGSNGPRMKNHPSWQQVWENSQRSTATPRRIPWTELKQTQENEQSRMSTLCWTTWN